MKYVNPLEKICTSREPEKGSVVFSGFSLGTGISSDRFGLAGCCHRNSL